MADTLYSHDLRIVTCLRCGAPLEARIEGGSFTCGFCSAENQLARRDESKDLATAHAALAATVSEAERHKRLREQAGAPPPLPPEVTALLVHGALPSDGVEGGAALWNELRSQLGAGAPFATSETLFHLTIALAPQCDARVRRTGAEGIARDRDREPR